MSKIKQLLELSIDYSHGKLSYSDLMIECGNDIKKAQAVIDASKKIDKCFSSSQILGL